MAEKQEQTPEATDTKQEAAQPEEKTAGKDVKDAKAKDGKELSDTQVSSDTSDIIDANKKDENTEGYQPLFDEETVFSEAELTGETDETRPDEKKEEKSDKDKSDKQPADQKADKEKQAAKEKAEQDKKAKEEAEAKAKTEKEAKKKAEAEAKKKEDGGKPPEGYVAHEALHEEREKRKELSSEVKQLRDEIATLKAEKEKEPEPELALDFKILTEAELEELIEDDPAEALKYQTRLLNYNTKKAEVEKKAEKQAQEQRKEAESIVYGSVDRIEKAVPGIYDDDSEIAKELAEFAVKSGFKDEAFLEVMTNPATVIIPAGQNKKILLGNGAASLVEMLHNVHKSSAESQEKVDVEKVRSEVRTELEKELTEKITKDILAKLKTGNALSDYRSIEELPGSQEDIAPSGKEYSEAEFAKLPEEEQRKLLGG